MSALLALFTRSLREDARVKTTYWVRPILAGMVLVMLIMVQSMAWITYAAPGLKLFGFVLHVNVFFVTLAGMSYFASAITEEKEEMTLGLLRMTQLNPLSILLGKSTSRLCGALMMLAAQFPFTLLAVSLGGVSTGQVIAVYVALGAYLVLIANLGLFASVLARRTGGAATIAGVALFLLFFGPFCLWAGRELLVALHWTDRSSPGPDLQIAMTIWEEMSVFVRLNQTLRTGFSDDPWCFQVTSNVVLGGLCFLAAWASFNTFCGEQKEAAPSRGPVGRKTSGVWLFAPGRPWRHALVWKDFFFMGGGRFAIGLRVALYAMIAMITVTVIQRNNWSNWRIESFCYTVFFLSGVVMLAEVSALMARVFRQERRWKTLSSLMLLPMSTRRIAYHKVLGTLLVCAPTFALWLGSGAVLMGEIVEPITRAMERDRFWGEELFWIAVGIALLFVGILCFLHLVVYLSLRLRWGALALAIAIFGTIMFFSSFLTVMLLREGAPIILLITGIITTIVLNAKIGERLILVSAED